MNIAPEVTYEAVLDHGTTGLTGTLRLRLIDNDGATTQAAASTGITEVATGVYSAERISPDTAGLYTLVWDDGTLTGVLGVETLYVTTSSEVPVGTPGTYYATVEELARILKIRTPSAEQTLAMERVMATAMGEIDSEIDLAADADALAGWQLQLAAEVNLERAVEHWRQQESPFGLIGLGPEMPAERTAHDSWNRHAHKLAPLKNQWGVA